MIFNCSPLSFPNNLYVSLFLCDILDLFEAEIKHNIVYSCCYEREDEVNSDESVESFECEDNTYYVLE